MAYHRSEKEQKYDRQMRLWGAHGQEKLEKAQLCMIGAGATAAETLKNLVLPSKNNRTTEQQNNNKYNKYNKTANRRSHTSGYHQQISATLKIQFSHFVLSFRMFLFCSFFTSLLSSSLVCLDIGHFTIIDDALVHPSDVGVNFFVQSSDIGKPRAQVVAENLHEMNPDVQAQYIIQPTKYIIQQKQLLKQ